MPNARTPGLKIAGAYISASTYAGLAALAKANHRTLAGQIRVIFNQALLEPKITRIPNTRDNEKAMNPLLSCGDPIVDSVRRKLIDADGARDTVCIAVAQKLAARSRFGQIKYKTPLASAGLTDLELLNHAQEEAMDLSNYLEALIQRDSCITPFTDMQGVALALACGLEVFIGDAVIREGGEKK